MNTRLRDAIQAILRDQLRGLLSAAMDRAPVLGDTSIARPSWRVVSESPETLRFFFESGAIDVSNVGGTYTAELFLNDYIVSGYTPTADLDDSSGINDSDRLWPLGEVDISTVSTPLVGDITPETGSAGTSRVLQTSSKVLTAAYVPASLFTGKLRLFVQSLYSVRRNDISLGAGSETLSVLLGDFALSHSGINSQWLYTSDDWRFFIVWVDIDGEDFTVHFRELVARTGLSVDAAALRSWAIGLLNAVFPDGQQDREPWELACLQSLVFALSAPDTTDAGTVVLSAPSTTYPLGEPLAYGWHSDWTGSQARIVLINPDTYSTAFVSTTLTVGVSLSGTEFSATVTASEETADVDNRFCVWVPSGVYQLSEGSYLSPSIYQCSTVDPGDFTISSPQATYSIPVYGWYKSDGSWIDVSLQKEEVENNYQSNTWGPVVVCHGGGDERTIASGQGTATRRTLSIGSTSVKAVQQDISTLGFRRSRITSGASSLVRADGQYMSYGNHSQCVSGGDVFPGCGACSLVINWYNITVGLGQATYSFLYSYSASGNLGLVILHNDCEAAIGVSSETGYAEHGTTYSESGVDLSPYARAISEVKADMDGEPGFTRWSGDARLGEMTRDNGNFRGSGTNTDWTAGSTTRYKVLGMIGSSAESIAEWTVRAGGGSGSMDYWSGLSTIPTPSPYGESGGTSAEDWLAFLEAPDGVCSNGNRAVALNPAVAVSAVEMAIASFGVPSPGVSDGGYSSGVLFVGAA